MYEVDLHLHTYYSDGVYSPEEVAEMAHRQGVKKLSITDHDGVWGLYEGRIAAKKYGIEFVNGIELSTEHQDRVEIHILGHGFDEACPEILKAGEEAMTARRSRNERLVQALGEEGYDITIDELYRGSKTGYVGKPHIAKLLKQKGYVASYDEAFSDIFERENIRKIKKEIMTSEEAIDVIRKAGGRATLAHPGKIKKLGERGSENFFNEIEKIVKRLCSSGMGGIECCHSDHNEMEIQRFSEFARKYNLDITAGSDFHG